jgi:superfamily II DNA or RNA helicase/HKD family nuclease
MERESIQFLTNKPGKGLFHELKYAFSHCVSFSLSIAFIHLSGLQLFIDDLEMCSNRHVHGRIVTTNYMNGTEPNALLKLLSLANVKTRVYDTSSKNHSGFHTKGYLFDMGTHYRVIVGSSNLTHSALKTNQEWNIGIYQKNDLSNTKLISSITEEFNSLWNTSYDLNTSFIDSYSKSYYLKSQDEHNQFYSDLMSFLKNSEYSKFLHDLANYMDIDIDSLKKRIDIEHNKDINPNSMQEGALERLYKLRHAKENKALIIAATGTGKTYLAAFDVFQVLPKKMLFVVHRAKILKDAEKSFRRINPNISTGILTGTTKDYDADYLFSSNLMISKDDVLSRFERDYFDYIVIDEAHRSSSSSYQKILNYFQPKFLLGMTATPERTDAKSIIEYFDHNIAVELRLRKALEDKLVVPFHYFGIDDTSTDLSNIKFDDVDKLAEKLNIKVRVDLILEHVEKYGFSGKKRKALGFCVNVTHAKYMSEQFNSMGYSSTFLYGDHSEEEREYYINRLEDENDPLSFLFTVDIFNEGIDIPSVNLILLLRPTESSIIFTQQLGRGLRLSPHKEFLTVLDFIGNHNKNFLLPIALSGDKVYDKDDLIIMTKNDFFDIPGNTFVSLAPIAKERILRQLEEVNFNAMKYLRESYQDVKRQLLLRDNKTPYPRLYHFSLEGIDPVRMIHQKGSYLKFVSSVENIPELDEIVTNNIKMSFINFVDNELPIKRPYEFAILHTLLENDSLLISDLLIKTSKYIDSPTPEDLLHALEYLQHKYSSSDEVKKYGQFIFSDGLRYSLSPSFMNLRDDTLFMSFIQNTLDYGLTRYHHEFGYSNYGHPFLKPHSTYGKIDVIKLARFEKGLRGMIMNGLIRIHNDYYVFINLNKIDVSEKTNYQDKFLNQHTFQWESPHTTKQSSKTGYQLIHHQELGIRIHMFVRKYSSINSINNGYSSDLTYLGPVNVLHYQSENPIRFVFEFVHPIPEDLYVKFTEVSKIG